MRTKKLRGAFLLLLVVPASIGSFVGVFAHVEWLQRTSVMLLLIVGTVAFTDWLRAQAD